MSTTRSLTRLHAVVVCLGLTVLTPRVAVAQGPHAALVQAYRQSVTYLESTLVQSNRAAAIDASVTVIAVHRALSTALNLDMARLRAASRRVELGEAPVIEQVADAELERASHVLFAGNWIGDGNPEARQAALDGTQEAIDLTETATAAVSQLLQRAQGVAIPPALMLDVRLTRNPDGTFVLLADARNVGDEVADQVSVVLENGPSAGGDTQEVPLGTLAPGASVQHVFAVSLPPGQPVGFTSVQIRASNASSEVFAVNLDAN